MKKILSVFLAIALFAGPASSMDLKRGKSTTYKRSLRACVYCKVHKKKCDGEDKCENCKINGANCEYLIPLKRGRKHKNEKAPILKEIYTSTGFINYVESSATDSEEKSQPEKPRPQKKIKTNKYYNDGPFNVSKSNNASYDPSNAIPPYNFFFSPCLAQSISSDKRREEKSHDVEPCGVNLSDASKGSNYSERLCTDQNDCLITETRPFIEFFDLTTVSDEKFQTEEFPVKKINTNKDYYSFDPNHLYYDPSCNDVHSCNNLSNRPQVQPISSNEVQHIATKQDVEPRKVKQLNVRKRKDCFLRLWSDQNDDSIIYDCEERWKSFLINEYYFGQENNYRRFYPRDDEPFPMRKF